ncbi:hypothetical protein KDA_11200 [Dictyobacter alpinus]|uniref:Uncharacterized protein n=1 Tax=Dictyobacter alpinus TaxID=2014873 RepID=A0A402B2R1_9CHLR|nr:hypothetical protein KDA_11200 [Dictyobacter alpinus]
MVPFPNAMEKAIIKSHDVANIHATTKSIYNIDECSHETIHGCHRGRKQKDDECF